MSAKVILVFCAQAFFIQLAHSACAGRPNLGASNCAGSVLPAPVLPTPGCSGLGYNGIGYGNAGIGYGNAGIGYGNAGIGYGNAGIGYGNAGIGYGNAGIGYGSGLGYGSNLAIEVIPTSGGSLPVSSSSSISPIGLSVISENVIEGTLYVTGELPFESVVAVEGVVPSGGAGAVSHSCGNGVTAIESITPSAAAIAPAPGAGIGAYGPGLGAYGAGIAPLSLLPGAGCNAPIAEIVAPIDGCYPPGIYY